MCAVTRRIRDRQGGGIGGQIVPKVLMASNDLFVNE